MNMVRVECGTCKRYVNAEKIVTIDHYDECIYITLENEKLYKVHPDSEYFFKLPERR